VRLNVDVLITAGTPVILAAKQATTTIPIVMAGSGDAVGTGLVASLARPGGNVTGLTDAVPELMAKWLELLKEAVPVTERVAVLVNPNNPTIRPDRRAIEARAGSLKVELLRFDVRHPNEMNEAFANMTKSRVEGIVLSTDGVFNANHEAIASLAL
jgi:putative ABC transport system substrate-binding protein